MRLVSVLLLLGAVLLAVAASPAGARLAACWRSLRQAARRRRDEWRIERELRQLASRDSAS